MTKTCSYVRMLSFMTWRRINFCRNNKLKIYETTITQNILFFLFSFPRLLPGIKLYESTDESSNGNDLLIEINTRNGLLKLPAQCKIIYSDGKYPALRHGDQINDLINYAESPGIQGIPIYIFYNWFDPFTIVKNLCGIDVEASDYGCTYVDAYTLKNNFTRGLDSNGYPKWKIPHFNDLHPNLCDPLWRLVCCHDHTMPGDNLLQLFNLNMKDKKYVFHPDSEDTLAGWREVVLTKRISDGENNSTKFNPRFKIRISQIK